MYLPSYTRKVSFGQIFLPHLTYTAPPPSGPGGPAEPGGPAGPVGPCSPGGPNLLSLPISKIEI